jgi:polar amino acid transport system substrate-binding protein
VPAAAQTLKGFEDDSSLRLAVIKSFSYGEQFDLWLEKLKASQRIVEVSDFETLLRVFMAHRVQAIIALPISWSPLQKNPDFRQHVLIKDWLPSNTLEGGLVVSKKRVSKTQADLLEKALHDMNNDGSMLKIFKQHVNPDIAEDLLINPHH